MKDAMLGGRDLPAGEITPGGVAGAPGAVTSRVHDMYVQHPFPPPQRKNSYRHHAAFVRRFLASRGTDPRGKRFGDIACGTGLMMLDYAREFPEATFVGYDISEVSVERANRTFAEEGVTNATAEVRDIMALNLDAEFDYIVSWGTIHHLADSRDGVARLCRALKPGGILRTGIYGHYGNHERQIQREIIRSITADGDWDPDDKIQVVREWARGDRNFKNYYTAPPVDLNDDDWVVDEFLHVWEQNLRLVDVVLWFLEERMEVLHLTDYYDQEIPLDIAHHSTSQPFIERVKKLPFPVQCHVIDMIVRPYWLSLLVEKPR